MGKSESDPPIYKSKVECIASYNNTSSIRTWLAAYLMEVVLKIRSTPIDSIYVCMCVTYSYIHTAQKMSVLLMRSIHCANDTGYSEWNEWKILNLCWLM